MSELSPEPSKPSRVASVDALRGITILLMVFVNDLGAAAPKWLHHIQPPNADGMTVADIVFPFFLFIAGVSIPLAFSAAKKRGHSRLRVLGHVLTRSLGLILMGLIEVNRSAEITLGPDWWGLIAFVSIILAWCVIPKDVPAKRTLFAIIKVVGVIGVVTMFAIYRREPVETNVLFAGGVDNWQWLRTEWWGILGLIGWAYLASALIYFVVGSRREWLMAAMALLMLNFLVSQKGGFFLAVDNKNWVEPLMPLIGKLKDGVNFINKYVDLGSQLGSLPAIMMAGCVLGKVLENDSDTQQPRERIKWAAVFAVGLFLAGLMTDTFAGINKISATPTWCFWSASLAVVIWIGLYFVMDIRGWKGWSIVVRPAGANPLIAYLLHPILLFVFSIAGMGGTLRGYSESPDPLIVVGGSLVMALVICLLTGLIAKCGLRVRI